MDSIRYSHNRNCVDCYNKWEKNRKFHSKQQEACNTSQNHSPYEVFETERQFDLINEIIKIF
jgi:hypothetical protein